MSLQIAAKARYERTVTKVRVLKDPGQSRRKGRSWEGKVADEGDNVRSND